MSQKHSLKNQDEFSDTELFLKLLAKDSSKDFTQSLQKSLKQIEGAYNFVILNQDSVYAVRDPWGFRPLVLGVRKLENNKESFVVSSESCAFDLIGAKYLREIEPGEILKISGDNKMESFYIEKKEEKRNCIFEHVYFARPDSYVFGKNVYELRKKMGQLLAKQSPVDADFIVPVPDSGVSSCHWLQ